MYSVQDHFQWQFFYGSNKNLLKHGSDNFTFNMQYRHTTE